MTLEDAIKTSSTLALQRLSSHSKHAEVDDAFAAFHEVMGMTEVADMADVEMTQELRDHLFKIASEAREAIVAMKKALETADEAIKH